ncbi:MAG: SulP family inorganic anion transporter [Actinomycetota bacterium]|nr:SulP family inorganic anion transporter [Actinomycetota bacterium]
MRGAAVGSSLRGYRRAWLAPDLLAGMALLAVAVPEQLATARLAGMPLITGYYAFVAGSVVFALLGSSPQLSVGADSTIAPLFAAGVAHVASSGSARYADTVGLVAVTVGVIVALVGLLRLGWIAELLSAPIIAGFMSGIAVIIVVHQVPDLLGVPGSSGSTVHRLVHALEQLGRAHPGSVALAGSVLVVVVVAEHVDRRLPGALVALVASALAVYALGLHAHGVAVLGHVAGGLPRWGLRDVSWHLLRVELPTAGIVALVVVSQTAATTRAFADLGRYEVDVGRDFVGVGAGNVLAGLVGSFPVDASPPRTALVASASGRTQASGLVACAVLVALVPAARLLSDVPLATLAAVLVFVASRIFRARELVQIARFDRVELGLALVTLVAVAVVGVEQGIAVAVALAILDRTRLSARPQLHVLGRIPGTTSWVPTGSERDAEQVPGVLAVLFATPLWYANAVHFRSQLARAVTRAPDRTRLVVLDTIGMSDLDFTGARALGDALADLERDHVVFAIARAGEHVETALRRSGLLARIGAEHLYPSVDEAVTALTR